MATEKPTDAHEESDSGAPEPARSSAEPKVTRDADFFPDEGHEQLSEREIFVPDEDFYAGIGESGQTAQAAAVPAGPGKQQNRRIIPQRNSNRRLPLSAVQAILVAGIIATGALLGYMLLWPTDVPEADSNPPEHLETSASRMPESQSPDPNSTLLSDKPPKEQTSVASSVDVPQPLAAASLKVAQDLYLKKEYSQAHAVYDQLYRSLPETAQMQRDFLKLKMAICTLKAGNLEKADRDLNETAKSESHIVKLMTNYHRILLDMQRKQYLNARKRAYLAVALIAAVDIDAKLASEFRSNCYFLIAEAMTRNVLALSDDDCDLPGSLWSADDESAEIDPFADLDNAQLQTLLKSGSDYLTQALLTPQIRKITQEDGTALWSVVCNGAPIDELLARFAVNAGLDVSWISGNTQSPLPSDDIVRTMPVVLYMPVANQQQLIAAAAGQVGLLAHIENNNTISVYQPDKFSSLAQHISLFCDETISLWQRFLLTFQSDKRIADAHFALGLLYSKQDNAPEAIAEYKLVANRFAWSSLAPYALFHSSKLKSGPNVRDFVGAKQDLDQLVSQYPDSDVTTQAYIHLAEYSAKAGMINEAARTYRRVYNLALSPQSQCLAALGAGKCFFQIADYKSAVEWLTLHIELAANQKNEDVCTAYALLGKTYLALKNPQQACLAFQRALDGRLPREDYVETVSALIAGYVEQGMFIQALDTLENVDFWQFSQAESVRVLLLKSKILQEMGLIEKAIAVLSDQAEYIPDPQLKAEMLFEIANCHLAAGELRLAHEELTKLLPAAQPGPLAHSIAIRLAETCSMLGLNTQAVSICTQLMLADIPEQIRSKAAVILSTAYNAQQDYDNAALALLDKQE